MAKKYCCGRSFIFKDYGDDPRKLGSCLIRIPDWIYNYKILAQQLNSHLTFIHGDANICIGTRHDCGFTPTIQFDKNRNMWGTINFFRTTMSVSYIYGHIEKGLAYLYKTKDIVEATQVNGTRRIFSSFLSL